MNKNEEKAQSVHASRTPITERPTPGGMSIASMDFETLRTLLAPVLSEELGRPVVVEAIGWRDMDMEWDVVVRDAAR